MDDNEHTVEFPFMLPAESGAELTETLLLAEADEPQLLFAVTVIIPPDIPATAFKIFVAEFPVHPPGNVHVYDVAPLTSDVLNVLETELQTIVSP